MKRFFIAGLFALSGCLRASTGGSGGDNLATGGSTARAAVERFLAAVRAQDLQEIAMVWGTDKGPARDRGDRENVEKSTFIMACYLGHEQFRILGETAPTETKRIFRVALSKGNQTRETDFHTIEGPGRRWYVEDAPLEPVKDLRRYPPNACAS